MLKCVRIINNLFIITLCDSFIYLPCKCSVRRKICKHTIHTQFVESDEFQSSVAVINFGQKLYVCTECVRMYKETVMMRSVNNLGRFRGVVRIRHDGCFVRSDSVCVPVFENVSCNMSESVMYYYYYYVRCNVLEKCVQIF